MCRVLKILKFDKELYLFCRFFETAYRIGQQGYNSLLHAITHKNNKKYHFLLNFPIRAYQWRGQRAVFPLLMVIPGFPKKISVTERTFWRKLVHRCVKFSQALGKHHTESNPNPKHWVHPSLVIFQLNLENSVMIITHCSSCRTVTSKWRLLRQLVILSYASLNPQGMILRRGVTFGNS